MDRNARARYQNGGGRRRIIARIVVFAFDLTEAAQIRRISSLIELGHDVRTVSFRRDNMNAGFVPDWSNLDLGYMPNERFGTRVFRLLRATPQLFRGDVPLRDAEVIIARNFDLLVLAWVVRALTPGVRGRLIYECLDIHGLFTRRDLIGRGMRFLERRLLKRIDLLWTSSSGFLTHYFQPMQGYTGPSCIIENKIWFDGAAPQRPRLEDRRTGAGSFMLGWVGSIRCRSSLELLATTAERLGPTLQIAIHGNVHRHAVPDFDAVLARHENMIYHGPYRYPDDLAAIYLGCDAVWAQDLWQIGGNSDWLLPNRIYEAGWFGCPAIAVAGTETARRVGHDGLGYVIDEASPDALVGLLEREDKLAFRAIADRLLKMPDRTFRLDPLDVADALKPVLGGGPTQPKGAPGESASRAQFR